MSAAAQRTPRSRRGRVIVVGDGLSAHLDQLDDMLAHPAERFGNVFDALGRVTTAGASDSVAAVVVAESQLTSPHGRAAEAMKRIDPSVRVIGMTGSADAPATGSSKAFDAWLTLPLRSDELKRAIDDDGLLATARTAGGTPAGELATAKPPVTPPAGDPKPTVIELPDEVIEEAPAPEQHPPLPVADSMRSAGEIAVADPSSHAVQEEPAVPAEPARHSAATILHALPPAPAAIIGDTDLIHAMLHAPGGLTPLALQLIAHHGGWRGVHFANDVTASQADSNAGIEVSHGSRRFGTLFADDAAPGQLRPWGDWLAQWLNMEAEFRRLQKEAGTDDLTGAGNRRTFERFLAEAIAGARPARRTVTIMVFDIDNFKPYNDRYGHDAGDEILREIVRLMQSVIRQGDIVCRIGGDEFAVVFADPEAPRTLGSTHPELVELIARRFQEAVCSMRFPRLGQEAPGTLSVSAGLASFPWDGQDALELLRLADQRAIESKRKGKNALTLGPDRTTCISPKTPAE